jgi:hypothetical protein
MVPLAFGRPDKRVYRALGQVDRDEVVLGIKIILSGFIDHAQEMPRHGRGIGDLPIHLAQFQGRLICVILDAEKKLARQLLLRRGE